MTAGSRSRPRIGFSIAEDIVQALARAANERPLFIGIDDLEAADRSSQRVVDHLAGALDDLPIVVMATCRTPAPDTAFERYLVEILRHSAANELVVSGLAPDDVAAYLHSAYGYDREVAEEVWHLTAGNPLFISEAVRILGEARPGHVDRMTVRLTSALRTHLSAVDDSTSELLEALAVVGDHATQWLLAEMVGDGVEDCIEMAMAAGVIERTEVNGDPGVRFRHTLLRDAVYADLDPTARRVWHERAASVLATRPTGYLDALARHRCASVTPATAAAAATVARQAAARATRMHAYDEAAGHLARAASALALDPDRSRRVEIELLVDNADAYHLAGRFDEALDCYGRAFDLADEAGLSDLRVVVATRFEDVVCESGHTRWGGDDRSIHQLERVVQTDGATIDPALWSRAKAALGRAYFFVGKGSEAQPLVEEAVRLARSAQDTHALAFALECRRAVEWAQLTDFERAALCAEIDAYATEADSPDLVLQARHFALYGPLAAGDLVEVDRIIAAFSGLASRLRRPNWLCYADLFASMRSIHRADIEVALGQIASAESHGQRIGSLNVVQFCTAQRFSIARMTGQWGDLGDRFSSFVGPTGSGPTWRCMGAQLMAEMGEADLAKATLDSAAQSGYQVVEDDAHRLFSLCCLAEAAIVLDDGDRAGELLELLLPHTDVVVPNITGLHGVIGHVCGGLAAVCGDIDEARRLLEDALARHLTMGATSWVVFTRLRLARLFLASSGSDDQDRIRDLLEAAAVVVSDAALALLRSQVETLGVASRRDLAHPLADLSDRELEVAALLADGRSNVDISRDLYISVKTVKSHVSNILSKLGLRSRTEVALLVQREGFPQGRNRSANRS